MITRKFISAICLILLAVNLYAQGAMRADDVKRELSDIKKEREKIAKLKVKTKAIKEYASEEYAAKKNAHPFNVEISKYDEKGNIVEKTYDGRTFVVVNTAYKYDKDCNIIEMLHIETSVCTALRIYSRAAFDYDQKGSIEGIYIYVADTNARGKEAESELKYSLKDRTTYSYNDKEQLIDGKYVYKYDDKGNKIEQTELNQKGEVVNKYEYIYDENGLLNKVVEHYFFGKERTEETRVYIYEYAFYDQSKEKK